MKTCPRCKIEKDDEDFYKNPKTEKLGSFCKPCKILWERNRRDTHKEYYRAYSKDYRKRNPKKSAAAQKKWRSENKEHVKRLYNKWALKNRLVYEADRRKKNRDAVFNAYGGYKCACCNEKEQSFLTIDHIKNDGASHRRELQTKIGKGGTSFFQWLVTNNFPLGFQVLCRNCNWGKHANYGVCPHNNKS